MRGVSPYSGDLYEAIMEESAAGGECQVTVMDFASAMPGALYPGGRLSQGCAGREIAWWNPFSWLRVASGPQSVVHLQYWTFVLSPYFLLIAFFCRIKGKRVVVTLHNPAAHENLWVFDFTERIFLKLADVLIVHGERGRGSLYRRFGSSLKARTCVVPHGVSDSAPVKFGRDAALILLDLPRDCRCICMFGNLRGYKGVDILLAAWSEIEEDFPDVTLVIAGRLWGESRGLRGFVSRILGLGKEAEKIRKALALPRPGRVKLVNGFIADKEIDALISVSEFAVFPYKKFSSQSGAASRAAGHGCPVLVSDVGELPTLAIADDWIVDPGDITGLAVAMRSHLVCSKNLRDAQRKKVASFSWRRVAKAHLDVYAGAASGRWRT